MVKEQRNQGHLAEDVRVFTKRHVFTEVTSTQQQIELQQDLRKIENWCLDNSMQLNAKKCQVMTFGRTKMLLSFNYYLHGAQLDRTLSIKDLGVHLTPCLDPGLHIAKICSKANSVLGLIARSSRGSLSTASVKVLYNSLVRPILEYASPVWSP
ncbi:uncharacterized protein LOC128989555 [Macrosteles quadrilineatus]|uniref:uncharacterized protein LOC128989555 n=1 Tax=Macrosteles quadrilineatus TaxID=74068 RepID=UPI0023E2D5A1|nr:uncharacterized protein LOC128989555 [Macrosteles quadrilineatus]